MGTWARQKNLSVIGNLYFCRPYSPRAVSARVDSGAIRRRGETVNEWPSDDAGACSTATGSGLFLSDRSFACQAVSMNTSSQRRLAHENVSAVQHRMVERERRAYSSYQEATSKGRAGGVRVSLVSVASRCSMNSDRTQTPSTPLRRDRKSHSGGVTIVTSRARHRCTRGVDASRYNQLKRYNATHSQPSLGRTLFLLCLVGISK